MSTKGTKDKDILDAIRENAATVPKDLEKTDKNKKNEKAKDTKSISSKGSGCKNTDPPPTCSTSSAPQTVQVVPMELMKDSFNELGKMFKNSMDSFGERLSQQFTEFRESLELDYDDEELEEFQETEETVINDEAGDNDFF